MTEASTKPVRCAIYTRVSTDQGLEQEFNSLDAQYDAAEAYIRSQAHAGWTLLRGKYDDGGFSGGNTDRPALQRLLGDVRAGRVDVHSRADRSPTCFAIGSTSARWRSRARSSLANSPPSSIRTFLKPCRRSLMRKPRTRRGREQNPKPCWRGASMTIAVISSSPTHCRKGGVRYRYYISSALLHGAAENAGSVRRVPAAEIEAAVTAAVREHIKSSAQIDDPMMIATHLARAEVQPQKLIVRLAEIEDAGIESADRSIHIPWQKPPSRCRREILLPAGFASQTRVRPIRAENRATLVAAIARGRGWVRELMADPTATAETIAKREGCSARKVNMTISLAFLAPDLVKAAIEGRLPHRMGVTRLSDLPTEWSRQHELLGLPGQS